LIVVSGCLLGVCCRYDGLSKPENEIIKLARLRHLLPVCPEQLGGLPTPRPPAFISGGDGFDVLEGKARVLTVEEAKDVTSYFLRGAMECKRIVEIFGVKRAILKSRSPSCGVILQTGVAAAALILSGVQVSEAG